MSVAVCFMRLPNLGGKAGAVGGPTRKREVLALNGTTTATAQEGEWAVLTSTETAVCCFATGTTPDAAATTETSATTAGADLPVGEPWLVKVNVGDKVNVKAFA